MFNKLFASVASRLGMFRLLAATALAGSVYEVLRPWLSGGCSPCSRKFFVELWGELVPLGWLGVGTAAALLLLSFGSGIWTGRLRTALALTAGGAGLALLLVQIGWYQALCPNCCVIDSALLLLGLLESTSNEPAVTEAA
jgi:hypothetical protein